jgi:hypothetical protein
MLTQLKKTTNKTTLQSVKQPYQNKKFKQFWLKIFVKHLIPFKFVNPVPLLGNKHMDMLLLDFPHGKLKQFLLYQKYWDKISDQN